MASDRLFELLAEAKGRPSKALRAVESAGKAGEGILGGYRYGQGWGDEMRRRGLEQQTLEDALGGQPIEKGLMNLTGESGAIQHPNIMAEIALRKAEKERMSRGLQFVGTQGKSGILFDPNTGQLQTTGLPPSDEPLMPRTVTPTLSPYATPSGQPMVFTPGRGLTPAPSTGGGTPVLKQGNEQAISDTAIMQTQIPNIDKLFDAYKAMGPVKARLQATPAGSVIDPVAKQEENSLKLAAFTFGGKQLTGQEKQVVFGAFFPSVTDNAQSLENKRSLLKNYFAGKIDLLQAANLLGPAGAPLRGMLQSKQQTPAVSTGAPTSQTYDPLGLLGGKKP